MIVELLLRLEGERAHRTAIFVDMTLAYDDVEMRRAEVLLNLILRGEFLRARLEQAAKLIQASDGEVLMVGCVHEQVVHALEGIAAHETFIVACRGRGALLVVVPVTRVDELKESIET